MNSFGHLIITDCYRKRVIHRNYKKTFKERYFGIVEIFLDLINKLTDSS